MWKFKGKIIKTVEDIPSNENLYGFVYCITNTLNGKSYIGKKVFYSTTTKKFGKKKIASMTDKRLKKYERVTKESNWINYWGSCKELKDDLLKHKQDNFTRTIIALANCKKQLTYLEIYHQMRLNVLSGDDYYNDNIAGKWYRKDIKSWTKSQLVK